MATSVEPRPLRADARRNREAILAAAKAVFARSGPEAQMDDIARRAKLGVGTVYRHFPTKDALIRALVVDRVTQIARFVEEALDNPDAWNGMRTALMRGAELGVRDRAIGQLFGEQGFDIPEADAPRERLFAAMGELIRRAQAAGQVRADLRVEDIPVVMCGVMNAMHLMAPDRRTPGPWQRHLQLLLDGMRACNATEPLPD